MPAALVACPVIVINTTLIVAFASCLEALFSSSYGLCPVNGLLPYHNAVNAKLRLVTSPVAIVSSVPLGAAGLTSWPAL